MKCFVVGGLAAAQAKRLRVVNKDEWKKHISVIGDNGKGHYIGSASLCLLPERLRSCCVLPIPACGAAPRTPIFPIVCRLAGRL